MGQYYVIANLDRMEYLYPHKFDNGVKLMEFCAVGCGVLAGLAILLADGNGRGGGDLDTESEMAGRWRGERIIVAGDYADGPDYLNEEQIQELREAGKEPDTNVYDYAFRFGTDISEQVMDAMLDDEWVADRWLEQYRKHTFSPFANAVGPLLEKHGLIEEGAHAAIPD